MKARSLSLCAVFGWALLCARFASATTSAYPTPLVGKAPPGSLIYDPSVSGAISGANPTDSYTLTLDAGQTLTVLVTPASSLQATVTMIDPSASTIGTATASGAGAYALLETVAVAASGTYTITIGAAGGTTGSYTAQATLNAALEAEIYSGSTDDTIGTAFDLSASAVPLATGADRMAVLGGIGGATDTDVYSFTLSAGQVATLAVTSLGAGASQFILEDGSGNPLAVGMGGAPNVTQVITRYTAPSAATYYAVITGDAGIAYSLVVTRAADFDTEPNDTLATAQFLTVGTVLGALPSGDSSDFYSFNANAGDTLALKTATPAGGPGEFVNTLYPELLLYDNNGNLVVIANGNAGDSRNSVINFTIPLGGTGRWSAQLVPSPSVPGTLGEYILTIGGATGAAVVPDLTVSKSHTGSFAPGQTGTWTITVHNIAGGSSTSGTVTAADTLPAGYTLNTYSGTGWSCSGSSVVTCTSSLVVNGGNDFPLLSLVVDVPLNSAPSVTNSVTVSGGGEADTTNDSTTDIVTIVPPTATATATPTVTPTQTPRGLGQSCSTGTQCASTFCAPSGVCCNVPCSSPGQSCTQPGSIGFCRAEISGVPAASQGGLLALCVLLAVVGVGSLIAVRYRRQP